MVLTAMFKHQVKAFVLMNIIIMMDMIALDMMPAFRFAD